MRWRGTREGGLYGFCTIYSPPAFARIKASFAAFPRSIQRKFDECVYESIISPIGDMRWRKRSDSIRVGRAVKARNRGHTTSSSVSRICSIRAYRRQLHIALVMHPLPLTMKQKEKMHSIIHDLNEGSGFCGGEEDESGFELVTTIAAGSCINNIGGA